MDDDWILCQTYRMAGWLTTKRRESLGIGGWFVLQVLINDEVSSMIGVCLGRISRLNDMTGKDTLSFRLLLISRLTFADRSNDAATHQHRINSIRGWVGLIMTASTISKSLVIPCYCRHLASTSGI